MKTAVEWYEKALEVIDDPELAQKTARKPRDPELAAKYEARYQQFKNIYPALADTFDKII